MTCSAIATDLAATSGARITVTDDVAAGVDGAGFVYTDVWVSMGEADAEWDHRVPLLTPYRVTADVMAATHRTDARFMHCLPSIHDTNTDLGRRVHDRFGLVGAEVTDDVFTSTSSDRVYPGREPDAHHQGAARLGSQRMTCVSSSPWAATHCCSATSAPTPKSSNSTSGRRRWPSLPWRPITS